MSAPPTTEHPARLAPAAALRRFYAATRELHEPAALYPALVAAWAAALGDAPVALLRPDPYRGGYRLRAAVGWPAAPVHELRLDPADLPPPLQATTFVPGAALRLTWPTATLAPFRPLLAVPLADGEGVLGLLLLGARPAAAGPPPPYRTAERTLLRLLAEPTTVALRAAVVARRAARNAEQLQALHQLGEELSANLDIESVYTAVYDQLRRALAFDSFFIARYEDELGMLAFPFGVDEGVRYTLDPVALGTGLTSAIYQSGRPLVIDDLRQGVAHLNIPQVPDAFGSPRRSRSWMGVPMIAKHRVIGVLAVQAYTPNLYSHEQVQFLSSVANQVAGTLENALLLHEREAQVAERVAELSALEEIARLLNANLDLRRVIGIVVARAVETTHMQAGVMALFDPAAQGLQILGHIGYPPAVIAPYLDAPLPISRGLLGRAVREDRTVLVTDVQRDPDYITVLPEIRAQLVVPVRRSGQILGLLSLESSDPAGFTREIVDFIEHLAEHAALAVDNARRYDRERHQNEVLLRRAGDLAAILNIGNALNADLSVDQVLQRVADGVRSSLGFNIAILSLYRPGPPSHFQRVASAGLAAEVWARLRAHPSPYAEGALLMNPRFQISQSYYISHVYNIVTQMAHYHRPDLDPRREGEWHPDDLLLVPLRGKDGQLVGVLSVDDPVDRQIPSRTTIETLEIFANQAVVALENARLFAEQRARLGELTRLQEIGVSLTATLDPLTLIGAVGRAAVRLFDTAASAVVLREDPLNPRSPSGAVRVQQIAGSLTVQSFPPSQFQFWDDQILAAGRLVLVPEAAADPTWGPALQRAGYQSGAGVPLRAGSRLAGVLYILHSAVHHFGPQEQQLIQIFATQAAVAIQNARLFDEEAHRLRDVTSLQAVGLGLTATLDTTTLLEEAVRLAIRLLAAHSSGILLLDADGATSLNVRCWSREGGRLELSTFRSPVRPGGLTDRVMRSGQPLTITDTSTEPNINPAVLAEGIRSLVAVPIRVGEQSMGVLFVNGYGPRAFANHEQQLLQVFANQVAVALQNARLFEERRAFEDQLVAENTRMARELVTARATQRQLLPLMPRHTGGLWMHGLCQPAMEVGGDYYDVVVLPDGRLALALGDVTGKGTSAVMLMAMIKTALLSQVANDPQPLAVLRVLNTLAIEYMQGQLMTFFYALYDPATRSLVYGNAGHLYPYIRRAAGQLDSLDVGGLPLGADPEVLVEPAGATLGPDDLLVLFSDGIVEAMSDSRELFGFDRLEDLLHATPCDIDPRLLVEDIVDRVHTFAAGDAQDDVTLFIARVEPA